MFVPRARPVDEMDSFNWKSRPRSLEFANPFLVTLMLHEIFDNNFYLLTWCYPKLLIGKNEDCNFSGAHDPWAPELLYCSRYLI